MSLKGKNNAWLKPSGQFVEVGYMEHNEYAQEWFTEKYGFLEGMEKVEELSGWGGYPYGALHALGWVRLLTWTLGKTKALGNCYNPTVTDNTVDPSLTKKQEDTLHQWCMDNDFLYEDLFTD